MTATNHVLTGALIGAAIHNPWVALPVALASHFVCDSLPHFDYPTPDGSHSSLQFFMWLALDMGLAASILVALWVLQPAYVGVIIVSGIVASSPDLMWLYYTIYKNGQNKSRWPWIVKFHGRIQKYQDAKHWPFELSWFVVVGYLLSQNLHP